MWLTQQKRKTIGKLFIDVFDEEAKIGGADYLAQGTCPDVESVSFTGGPSVTIKSTIMLADCKHMKMELVEPLKLFKDEVRA